MARTPAKAAPEDNGPIDIDPILRGVVNVYILGTSPLIFNRMGTKGEHELLFPSGKMNTAAKASTLKHDPLAEYRDSPNRSMGNQSDTRLLLLSSAFKGAMKTAALRIPGVTKTEIGQLVWVDGTYAEIFGTPQMFMKIVRMADMKHTPDVRTRAICPEWACKVSVRYSMPLLTARTAVNLLASGGLIAGVGDFRQEKGNGSYGQFELVNADDKNWNRIVATQGRQAQDEALASPLMYDAETEELYSWFSNEVVARGRQSSLTSNTRSSLDAGFLPPAIGKRKSNGSGKHA